MINDIINEAKSKMKATMHVFEEDLHGIVDALQDRAQALAGFRVGPGRQALGGGSGRSGIAGCGDRDHKWPAGFVVQALYPTRDRPVKGR